MKAGVVWATCAVILLSNAAWSAAPGNGCPADLVTTGSATPKSILVVGLADNGDLQYRVPTDPPGSTVDKVPVRRIESLLPVPPDAALQRVLLLEALRVRKASFACSVARAWGDPTARKLLLDDTSFIRKAEALQDLREDKLKAVAALGEAKKKNDDANARIEELRVKLDTYQALPSRSKRQVSTEGMRDIRLERHRLQNEQPKHERAVADAQGKADKAQVALDKGEQDLAEKCDAIRRKLEGDADKPPKSDANRESSTSSSTPPPLNLGEGK